MKEIVKKSDMELYQNYVVRDNILYMVLEKEILPDEIYAHWCTTPSTPPDFEVLLLKNIKKPNSTTDDKIIEQYVNEHYIKVINNMDYFYPEHTKSFILGIGEYKNWYDEK